MTLSIYPALSKLVAQDLAHTILPQFAIVSVCAKMRLEILLMVFALGGISANVNQTGKITKSLRMMNLLTQYWIIITSLFHVYIGSYRIKYMGYDTFKLIRVYQYKGGRLFLEKAAAFGLSYWLMYVYQ